jgi:methionyl-tRNA formyltransferase
MRIAFMGSPVFAVPALRALHAAGHDIAAVYCQPPRPAGRGHRLTKCAVHEAADALGLPVHTPARLKHNEAAWAAFRALELEAAVVAAYGLILPAAMLDAPARGCLNIHASLLPRWRGAAPIQAAIMAGDTEIGITIMRMDEGLDTGPMLLREAVPITPKTTTPVLHDALAALGARLILCALAKDPPPEPQPEQGTYAPRLTRADGRLDWLLPAEVLERRVRALNPWPGTFTGALKVLEADVVPGDGPPGMVLPSTIPPGALPNGLIVACGAGALRLLRVQPAGRGAMAADAYLRGHPVPPGTFLD